MKEGLLFKIRVILSMFSGCFYVAENKPSNSNGKLGAPSPKDPEEMMVIAAKHFSSTYKVKL